MGKSFGMVLESRGGPRLGIGHRDVPAAQSVRELEAHAREVHVPGVLPLQGPIATSLGDIHHVDGLEVAGTDIEESSDQEIERAHADESAPDLP
jgi:hypothetical protein